MIPSIIASFAIDTYAESSHEYYHNDNALMSDHEYDVLCSWMNKNYDDLKPYDHKGYLEKGMLECGSGYHINLNKETE